MHGASVVLVTPALAAANNGNWQTARRWAAMLRPAYRVRCTTAWEDGDESLMIALHARRSAESMRAWKTKWPARPLLLALTGTDLYRDIDTDAQAQAALDLADRLVVLNEVGAERLPAQHRSKCVVVLQSCTARTPAAHTGRHLRALMVGHLRDEKDPQTYFRAARSLADRSDILMDHIGAALEPTLGEQAMALAAAQGNYRWLGATSHEATRRRIQHAHVLVHPSRIEGGAQVIIEAVRSATPVLASCIAGNIGLLGPDHAGYFALGDDAALAALLVAVRDGPDMLADLQRQTALRAPLFAPAAERAMLHRSVAELLQAPDAATTNLQGHHA